MVDKGKGIADDSSSAKRKRNGYDKSGNRKRIINNVLQYEIDDSSEDEDFLDFDISRYFEDVVGPDPGVKAEPKTPNIPFFPKEEEMDEEEVDKMMEERYKPGAGFVKYAEDRVRAARTDDWNTSMAFEKVPTIWKVKCMVGRERHSAFCLMQKYVDLKSLGTKLQIISAFAVEHMKGFVFIEAERQCDINEACKGLCNIYPTRAAPVPVSDVQHLFAVRSKYSGISVDTWARVKNGKYKGDLAQVVNVNGTKWKATVKLVPRIDLQAGSEKFGGGVTGKKSTVPAPRLITSSELEAYRPLVKDGRDRDTGELYEVFDGMCLKDGYLFKKVPFDSLSFWDVRPTEAELIKLSPTNKEESNYVEWLTGLFGVHKKKKPTISNNKGGKGDIAATFHSREDRIPRPPGRPRPEKSQQTTSSIATGTRNTSSSSFYEDINDQLADWDNKKAEIFAKKMESSVEIKRVQRYKERNLDMELLRTDISSYPEEAREMIQQEKARIMNNLATGYYDI